MVRTCSYTNSSCMYVRYRKKEMQQFGIPQAVDIHSARSPRLTQRLDTAPSSYSSCYLLLTEVLTMLLNHSSDDGVGLDLLCKGCMLQGRG